MAERTPEWYQIDKIMSDAIAGGWFAATESSVQVDSHVVSRLAAPLEAANKEIAELREAVRVLARDKLHGIADMIGADVLATPIARAAIEAARKEPNETR